MPYIQKMNMENRIGKIDILTYIMLVWLMLLTIRKEQYPIENTTSSSLIPVITINVVLIYADGDAWKRLHGCEWAVAQ